MENEELKTTTTNENNMYIDAIEELKKNSVSKEEYSRVLDENKKLLDTLISGGTVEIPEESVDLEEMAKDLREGLPEFEMFQTILKMREEIMKKGNPDPLIGSPIEGYSGLDVNAASHIADGLQYCIDNAGGDKDIFRAKLNSILKY